MRIRRIALPWWQTRRAMRMSAAKLAHLRSAKWQALQPHLHRTPALADHAGRPLEAFPIAEQAELRADYGRWNSLGLSHEQCRALADRAEAGDDTGEIVAGWSTGTGGGKRGLFLTDAAERADYLGQSLARLLPARALLHRQRIALHLRANSALYADVRRRRMAFAHFPLEVPLVETAAALSAYSPTILIAPPHRLIALAKRGARMPVLTHLFYGSEPMSAAECAFVAKRLGLAPRPIWQATEGFLGAACNHGRLHLNDHALEIELEPVPGTSGYRPIITDLHRHNQPIVRLRGDDFLELDNRAPCPCGFAGRTILPIAGRVSDLWRFPQGIVTPRKVIAAVEDAIGGGTGWQALANPQEVTLRVAPDCSPDALQHAAQQLQHLVSVPVHTFGDLPDWQGPKRRKVGWSHG